MKSNYLGAVSINYNIASVRTDSFLCLGHEYIPFTRICLTHKIAAIFLETLNTYDNRRVFFICITSDSFSNSIMSSVHFTIALRSIVIVTILILPMQEHRIAFHFFIFNLHQCFIVF